MRKASLSIASCVIIIFALVAYRFSPPKYNKDTPLIVTNWDALGYYFYLPSIFIYHDTKELKWFPEMDKKYSLSGGWLYQASKLKNGNYVFQYFGGVAILEGPFFFIANSMARKLGYPADGFSPPYQFAVTFGVIFYNILALFLFRKVLLKYYDDYVTSITLLLVMLATNVIQYISIDNAMSHGFILPLYILVLYFTIKWHENPKISTASIIGAIIGLATICRPTEAIMLLIPLLWNTQNKIASKEKWRLVKKNKTHLYMLLVFGFIAVLPQLIYWKIATGSFVFDVGSSWRFLTPFFRVLIGWEKGWFIYTPVTIFFIIGMFYIKNYSFKNSVIYFCLLNIWIIIAWADWRYGASYSCRALSQSYPVFALPLAAFINQIRNKKFGFIIYPVGLYLIFVNLFQLVQYNKCILHYDEMNRKYYFSIYLNPNPSSFDMGMMDNDERLYSEKKYSNQLLLDSQLTERIQMPEYSNKVIYESEIGNKENVLRSKCNWLKIESRIKVNSSNLWGCYICSQLKLKDSIKLNRIRIMNPNCIKGQFNDYGFYVKIPPYFNKSHFKLFIYSSSTLDYDIEEISVKYLTIK